MKEIKRFDEIDILKSIGIISMIMGHIGFGSMFDHYIHAFHMPMFYIISGFLYKKSNLTFKDFTIKKAKSLLVPYLIFAFFHLMILSVVKINLEVDYLLNIFSFNTESLAISGALWFLTSLFFVDIFYYLIDRIDISYIKIAIIILISFLGCLIPKIGRLPLAIDTSMVGVGLFAIGRYGRSAITGIRNVTNIFIGGAMFITGSIFAFFNGYVNVRLGQYSNLILFFVAATLVTYGLYLFCGYVSDKKSLILNELRFIGKNSLVYVCLNQLILLVLNKINVTYIISNIPIQVVYKIIVLIISLLLLHLITIILNTKRFKWILGK